MFQPNTTQIDGNGDIDWPFQFGIFFTCGKAQRKCDGRSDNDQLPSPEMNMA